MALELVGNDKDNTVAVEPVTEKSRQLSVLITLENAADVDKIITAINEIGEVVNLTYSEYEKTDQTYGIY